MEGRGGDDVGKVSLSLSLKNDDAKRTDERTVLVS